MEILSVIMSAPGSAWVHRNESVMVVSRMTILALVFIIGGCGQSDSLLFAPEPGASKARIGADVAISAFTASSEVVHPGEVLDLSVTVVNWGGQPSGPFSVGILEPISGVFLARKDLPGLAAGAGVSGTVHFSVPADKFSVAVIPGRYTLICGHNLVDADPANDRKEVIVEVREFSPPGETMEMYILENEQLLPCSNGVFLGHIVMQVVYHNPSISIIRGFECGWDLAGGLGTFNSSVEVSMALPGVDVGVSNPRDGNYNVICGFYSPLPTSTNTVLATLDLFYLDQFPLDLTMRNSLPSADPQNSRPIVIADDLSDVVVDMRHIPGFPSVQINPADCIVEYADDASFRKISSLFR